MIDQEQQRDHADERDVAAQVSEDNEREVARPNDGIRAQLLRALDVADRAGVQLSSVSGVVYRGRVTSVGLHGTTADGRMTYTEALRMALRLGRRGQIEVSDVVAPEGTTPHVRVAIETDDGVRMTLFADPSPAQLADAVAVAALRS